MALLTQIRLPSISGSFKSSAGDGAITKADRTVSSTLEDVGADDLTDVLQQFANAIGKISGQDDWTDAQDGLIWAGASGGSDGWGSDAKGQGKGKGKGR